MSRHHRFSGTAKGPEWERLRLQVFDRDGHRCRECGRAGRLEAHHVVELAHGGTNDIDDLQTLCRACHIDTHRRAVSSDRAKWMALVREL